MLSDLIPQPELAEQWDVTPRTLLRWRTEGKLVETRYGTEVIYLQSVSLGNRVLIPVSHEERVGIHRYLGATEFIAALGPDPVLRNMEVELMS